MQTISCSKTGFGKFFRTTGTPVLTANTSSGAFTSMIRSTKLSQKKSAASINVKNSASAVTTKIFRGFDWKRKVSAAV